MNGREKTLETMKDACIQQFDIDQGVYECDLLAGERGPSFSSVGQITNWKTILVRFVEHDRARGGEQGRQQKTKNEPENKGRRTAFSSAMPSTKTLMELSM